MRSCQASRPVQRLPWRSMSHRIPPRWWSQFPVSHPRSQTRRAPY
nr:MAG TPA: hypothetical protein [Caudoviricetes sp.]